MLQYHDLVNTILEHGERRRDRTGTGTLSVFGTHQRYDLSQGFPLLTTKRIPWLAVVTELVWFLEGSTEERRLCEILYGTRSRDRTTIWTANALDHDDKWFNNAGHNYDRLELGPVYGHQWRRWGLTGNLPGIDQIQEVVNMIQENPYSRRMVVSAWNPRDIPSMALPPCHCLFQFYVSGDGRLDLQLYQRSGDVFLGVPFNIASYSLLLSMVAHITELKPGWFVHSIGDAHIYLDHIEQCQEMLSRSHRPCPRLVIAPEFQDLNNINPDWFSLEGYDPHPAIAAKMSV